MGICMKILILSDEESKFLWDFFEKEKLAGIDLIISCGDLKAEYLSFLATFTSAPVLYVHGNHDGHYDRKTPDGCVCIDDRVFVYKGLRIAGLGGSMSYSMKKYQYTEKQMQKRLSRLNWRIRIRGGLDIFVAHAPALGLGDAPDLPHKGFNCFRWVMEHYKPHYFFHGHVHMNYTRNQPRISQYLDTTIVNAYERYVVEVPTPAKKRLFWQKMNKFLYPKDDLMLEYPGKK